MIYESLKYLAFSEQHDYNCFMNQYCFVILSMNLTYVRKTSNKWIAFFIFSTITQTAALWTEVGTWTRLLTVLPKEANACWKSKIIL